MNILRLLWLVPTLPLAGCLVLAIASGLSRFTVAVVGVGSVGLSALTAGLAAFGLIQHGLQGPGFTQLLWTWMDVAGLTPKVAFYLDGLSLVMMLIITGVGFLIHLYSVEYMAEDNDYQRFFAYMNLFVASMLTLVLADNLLLLFLGWEGVGLCSYLLIGFWYRDLANGDASRKAFLVTRIGDTSFVIGLFVIVVHLGTLDIQELMRRALQEWPVGSGYAVAAAGLLLLGALGKSAQIPLQVWLPPAMAGPTPVSALIHAATMVTAGVYLIVRLQSLYDLAPAVRTAIAVIGAVTLLLSGFSALVQRDIKRVLAFSTISQLGYMFLALGVAASSAAMFHLMTHAFFKALLFLAAGSIILSLHHEQDLFKMGGLRKELPLAFWVTLIGASSLAGVPLITAGFFSKERILWEVWSSPMGGPWLWAAGLVGVFVTALYSFRVVFLVFFGERKTAPGKQPGAAITVPLLVLAALSIGGGWMEGLLLAALPNRAIEGSSVGHQLIVQGLAIGATLLGIALAYLLFLRRPDVAEDLSQTQPVKSLRWLAIRGWAFNHLYDRLFVRPFLETASASKQDMFDRAYDRLLVRPFLRMTQINKDDFIDRLYDGLMRLGRLAHELFQRMQTGEVRWYATVLAAGSVTIVALMIWG